MFYGLIIRKLAETGHEKIVMQSVLLALIGKANKDFVWQRIGQSLFKHVSGRSHGILLIELLSVVDDGKSLTVLTGYDPENSQLVHLLGEKLFFKKIFSPPVDVSKHTYASQSLASFFISSCGFRSRYFEIFSSFGVLWTDHTRNSAT